MNTEQLLKSITAQSGLPEEEVISRAKKKQQELHGLLSKDGALHIIAKELGIGAHAFYGKSILLTQITPGMGSHEIVGRVGRIFPSKSYEKNGKKGSVGSITIHDQSGSIRVVFWDEQVSLLAPIKEEETISLENVRVQTNKQGALELHVCKDTRIRSVAVARRPLVLVHEDCGQTCVYGSIVVLYDIAFFEQCPACKKRLAYQEQQWVCSQHGVQAPLYGAFLPLMLDDGTATMRVLLFSKQIEQLFQCSSQQVQQLHENPVAVKQKKWELLGMPVIITGMPKKNKFFSCMEITASTVSFPQPHDVLQHLEKLP